LLHVLHCPSQHNDLITNIKFFFVIKFSFCTCNPSIKRKGDLTKTLVRFSSIVQVPPGMPAVDANIEGIATLPHCEEINKIKACYNYTIIGTKMAELKKIQKLICFFSRSMCHTTIRNIAKHINVLHMYCPVIDVTSKNTFNNIKNNL
jgi:hypothetical protein